MDRPTLKISETFLEFAKPVLEMMDEGATEDNIKKCLEIAYTVWNSVIMESVYKNDFYMKSVDKLIAENPPEVGLILSQLVTRKKTLFAEDKRLIGKFEVTYKDGDLHLRAEVRVLKKEKK